MRDVYEIGGVMDGNGKPLTVREDTRWAYLEMGPTNRGLSPLQCRRIARQLYRVARRIEAREGEEK